MDRRAKKGVKAFIGRREKQCNKCGFATYSLYVLYNHRYKCQGQLLGYPIICCYCKRKFNFLTSYRTHKAICVKKVLRRKFFRTKLKQKHLGHTIKRTAPEFSVSCPICQTAFTSKQKFVSHLKSQNCKLPPKKSKPSLTARKSLSKQNKSLAFSIKEDEFYSSVSHPEKHRFISVHQNKICCLWCKSSYPSKKLLDMHLEMNYECAKAYYKANTFNSHKKMSLTARKTVSKSARKSFPLKTQNRREIFNNRTSGGSARKSLPSSIKKTRTYGNSLPGTNLKHLYQCPICIKEFSDMFTFFQHQKKMNHWGKATKSINAMCKCPFCGKDFFHMKSRNAHVQNHTDISKDKIKAFFRNHTCNVCSQTFISELAKMQHMRIQHPSVSSGIKSEKYSASVSNTPSDTLKNKLSSVPRSVKKKLKQQPNTCPVCSKAFSHTVLRNKHFNEAHLKIFECQFCNTKFKSTSSLNNHIELIHGKDFECQECKVKLKDELQLLQHILKFHPNKDPKLLLPKLKSAPSKRQEQIASKEIAAKSNELLSNSFQFRNNAEYYCDVCDIGYLKLCGLQRHRQSKLHKDTLEKNLDAVQKSLNDLPPSPSLNPRIVKQPEILTCSECSEEFTHIKDFVPHRLSHFSVQGKYLKITELNPYMCEICSDVLDSHSKVQLHLFWHLQIESTANTNAHHGSSKKDTIVPDRLSGQHVAKKSFSKQNSESLQEVVIGGVSKPLFTCEACNIGFTTKAHYSMHVRKLCKKINPPNMLSENSAVSEINHKKTVSKKKDSLHCNKCNCLFNSTAKYEQHKPYCLKISFDSSAEDNLNNLAAIKFALKQDIAIAGCVTCGAVFDSVLSITGHLSIHQDDSDNSITDDINEDILHCALCNCLFPLTTFKAHKDFCKIPLKIGEKTANFKHMNVLKSALELKCAVAGCIYCGLPFDDLETVAKHLTLHQTNEIQNDPGDTSMCNGEETFISETEIKNSSDDKSTEILNRNLADNSSESSDQDHLSPDKSLDDASEKQTPPTEQEHDFADGDIEDLRKNFSQLLCLLISDPELMETLGYGTLLVDDVLVNVLQQMEQKPCTVKKLLPAEKFRTNIHTLLNLCLKDQIMEAIGTKKTTDEIVIEALRIFGSDVNIPEDED